MPGFCLQPKQLWATALVKAIRKRAIATEDCKSDESENAGATRGGRTPVVAPAAGI